MAWKKFSINSTFFNDIFSFDDEKHFSLSTFLTFDDDGERDGKKHHFHIPIFFQQLFMIRQTPSKNKSVQ